MARLIAPLGGLSSQSAGTRSLQPLPLAFLPFVPLSIKFGQDVGRDPLVTAPAGHKRLQVGRRVGLEPFLEGAHSTIVSRARLSDKAGGLGSSIPRPAGRERPARFSRRAKRGSKPSSARALAIETAPSSSGML